MNIRTFVAIMSRNPQHDFPKMRGGGQRQFGTFPKIHPFWWRHLSLSLKSPLQMYASMLQRGEGKNRAKKEEEESKNTLRTSLVERTIVRRTPFFAIFVLILLVCYFCNFLAYSDGWPFSLFETYSTGTNCVCFSPQLDSQTSWSLNWILSFRILFSYFGFSLWTCMLGSYCK